MIIIGLTGSIGMGKSVLARQLRSLGVPVHDADACVHTLLAHGGVAVAPVSKICPTAQKDGAIDRSILGQFVFNDPTARIELENILHPLVRLDQDQFLQTARRHGKIMAVLDIPLLFETRQEKRFEHIICVTAPQFVQKRRVLSRPGMSNARLRAVLKAQMPDAQKRAKAHTVINTACGYRATLSALKTLIKRLQQPKANQKDDPKPLCRKPIKNQPFGL